MKNADHRCVPDCTEQGHIADTGRHPKWQRVESGTVIPAGQPYRVEYADGGANETRGRDYGDDYVVPDRPDACTHFIDSSWKPPLVLPTEPTWGISVRCDGTPIVEQAHMDGSKNWQISGMLSIPVSEITDFIPLTEEQIKRIEAAR